MPGSNRPQDTLDKRRNMKQTHYAIGIDLGGTTINYALISSEGEFLFEGMADTPATEGAEAVLEALGAYTAFAETNSCYGDGKDKVYQYPSFKVMTYSSRGKDYLLSVEIFNDTDEKACTTEGICIGASTADVIATYGDAKEQSDSALVYVNTATKTRLQFLLRDGKVTNIQYLKSE